MTKKYKGIFFILGSILCVYLLVIAFHHAFFQRTQGFCIEKIKSNHSYDPRWETGELTPSQKELVEKLSAQTFSYLASGKACYAFVSEDNEYVIKFFKQKHMYPNPLYDKIPLPTKYRNLADQKKITRHMLREKTYKSYLIAYTVLNEETATELLHLNKKKVIHKKFHFVDQHGEKFSLRLDKMEFLIQKKASPIFDAIAQCMQENQIDQAKDLINNILSHVSKRSLKGVSDSDLNCENNLGVCNGKIVEIDIGEFTIDPSSQDQYIVLKEMKETTNDLKKWLTHHYPALASHLKEKLTAIQQDVISTLEQVEEPIVSNTNETSCGKL